MIRTQQRLVHKGGNGVEHRPFDPRGRRWPRRRRARNCRRIRRAARRGAGPTRPAGHSSTRSSSAAPAGARAGPALRRSAWRGSCPTVCTSSSRSSILAREAANSIARGRPSRRRQISAMRAHLGVVESKGGSGGARSVGEQLHRIGGVAPPRCRRTRVGTASGGTSKTRSPVRRSSSRLVTSTVRRVVRATSVGDDEARCR